MFEAEPPSSEVDASRGSSESPKGPLPPTFPPQPAIDESGSATWTIPLRINVSLGDRLTPAAPPAVGKPTTAVPPTKPGEDAALREALEELASARTRVYYDASADEHAASEYYAGIRVNVSAKTLFNHLSQLVRTTHKTPIAYKPARHVYPWVDLHPDLRIRSIYSGQDFDPETLIREDFRIGEERAARLRELVLTESTMSPEKLGEELDVLEAALPYNCEHVVPQSWFDKREPMRGDLHHLFACETRCNSFRGNIPYYDFPDFEEAVMDSCGKRSDDKFEPLRGKGAIARAVLYFLLRYPGHVGDVSREMQKDRLPTLLDWHNQTPPDDYEKHRNMAIFERQGNRNPLIDKPEWADRIAFSLGVD